MFWSITAENISAAKREPSAKRTGFVTRISIRLSLKSRLETGSEPRLKQQARPAVNNRTKAPLRRAAVLSGMRERVQPHDPLLERQPPVEYVCRGYQRNGKGYCSSHRIHEEVLDKAVWDDTEKLQEQYAAELKKVTQLQKQWALRKPVLDAHCLTLQKEILRLEQEVDELVMEKIQI